MYGVLLAISIGYLIVANLNNWTSIPGWIVLGLLLATWIWYCWYEPVFAYNHFGFIMNEEDLEIRSGWLWLKDTVVPMTRIQHVELERGPLLRKYNLAKIKVVTAATSHEVTVLELSEAESLKKRIGELAKVVDHDE